MGRKSAKPATSSSPPSLEELREMCGREGVCVERVEDEEVCVLLHPMHSTDIRRGVTQELEAMLTRYSPQLGGLPLAYENPRLVSSHGWLFDTNPFYHVMVRTSFYVFSPKVGSIVKGVVKKKSPNHLGCLVHGCFNVSVLRDCNTGKQEWDGAQMEEGDQVKLRLEDIKLGYYMPYFKAELDPESVKEAVEARLRSNIKSKRRPISDEDSGISSNEADESLSSQLMRNEDSSEEEEEEEQQQSENNKCEKKKKSKKVKKERQEEEEAGPSENKGKKKRKRVKDSSEEEEQKESENIICERKKKHKKIKRELQEEEQEAVPSEKKRKSKRKRVKDSSEEEEEEQKDSENIICERKKKSKKIKMEMQEEEQEAVSNENTGKNKRKKVKDSSEKEEEQKESENVSCEGKKKRKKIKMEREEEEQEETVPSENKGKNKRKKVKEEMCTTTEEEMNENKGGRKLKKKSKELPARIKVEVCTEDESSP